MPLRINLLAEAKAAEELRRKDPVKRAVWIGCLIVALMGFWSAQKQTQLMLARAELARLVATYAKDEKSFIQVNEVNRKLGDMETRLNALVRASTNRILWGSALHALQQTVTDDITFTRFRADQSYRQEAGVAPKRVDGKTVPGRPASATETLKVVIDGRDYARIDEQNYNRFKTALTTNSYFGPRLEGSPGFRLANLSQPVADPLKGGREYVAFSFEAQFPEIKRDE